MQALDCSVLFKRNINDVPFDELNPDEQRCVMSVIDIINDVYGDDPYEYDEVTLFVEKKAKFIHFDFSESDEDRYIVFQSKKKKWGVLTEEEFWEGITHGTLV